MGHVSDEVEISTECRNGQQVPVDKPFRLYDGRIKLMYPRDPSGPPGETINCGCLWIIVPESLAQTTA